MISTRTAVELIIGLILCVTLWVEYNSHEPLEIPHAIPTHIADNQPASRPTSATPSAGPMRTRIIYRPRACPAEPLVSGRNEESGTGTGDWHRAEELARMADADRDAMRNMASAVGEMR